MQKKTIVRWAIHKVGSEQFGYLCESEAEAKAMLADCAEPSNVYAVRQVEVSWCEDA